MPVYSYIAAEADSSSISGTIVADTPRQARDLLRQKCLDVQDLAEQHALATSSWFTRQLGRRQSTKVASFVRELSTLLAVGMPLLEAIDNLATQYKGSFARCLYLLRDQVAAGVSLAEAMRKQPQIFSELCGDIAEVGENAGTLDSSLAQLAEFQERSQQFKNKLTTALLYPMLVFASGIGVALFLMTFVVPNLLSTLVSTGRPLPLSTRLVKGASDLLVTRWQLLLVAGVVFIASVISLVRIQSVRRRWHGLQLRIPVLGDLIRKQAIVRLAVIISTLLKSGVVFVRALQVAKKSTRNSVIAAALSHCQQAVEGGADIAKALSATRAFPPVVVHVFAIGQQSGRLEEMLEKLASDYDKQVAMAAQRFTAVLEPLLILLLAVFVGTVAFATILPILESSNVF